MQMLCLFLNWVRLQTLITATMVSIDLHMHHTTRALSVSCACGMPHLPKSMVRSEASQADEGYFVLPLSLLTYLYISYRVQWHG
jgi:hypothetical protein